MLYKIFKFIELDLIFKHTNIIMFQYNLYEGKFNIGENVVVGVLEVKNAHCLLIVGELASWETIIRISLNLYGSVQEVERAEGSFFCCALSYYKVFKKRVSLSDWKSAKLKRTVWVRHFVAVQCVFWAQKFFWDTLNSIMCQKALTTVLLKLKWRLPLWFSLQSICAGCLM